MVVGFGFSPFFGDPFRFPVTVPGLFLRSTACDPAGAPACPRSRRPHPRQRIGITGPRPMGPTHTHSSAQAAGGRSRRPRWA